MHVLRVLFSANGFMPHGYCYLWNPGLVWLHVLSDSLIALAYFFNSGHARLLYLQASRLGFSVDVLMFWSIHLGLRRHACNGSMDSLARNLLVIRLHQSGHRCCFCAYLYFACPTGS